MNLIIHLGSWSEIEAKHHAAHTKIPISRLPRLVYRYWAEGQDCHLEREEKTKQPICKGPDNTPRYKPTQVGKDSHAVSLSHWAAKSGTCTALSFHVLVTPF